MPVGDLVPQRVRALFGRSLHDDPATVDHGRDPRIHLGQLLGQRQLVTVGIGVVQHHRDRPGAAGLDLNGVIDGVRGQQLGRPRNHADPNGALGGRAEGVRDLVGERVGAGGTGVGLVDEEVAALIDDTAEFGTAGDGGEVDRVAVGVDAVQRHLNLDGRLREGAHRERQRGGRAVARVIEPDHRESHGGGGSLLEGIRDRVGHTVGAGLVGRLEAHLTTGDEGQAAHVLGAGEVGDDRHGGGVGVVVVVEHRHADDVTGAHTHGVVDGDRRLMLDQRRHRHHGDAGGGGALTVTDRVGELHLLRQGGGCRDPQHRVGEDLDGDEVVGAAEVHRLHGEDPAAGRDVVVENRDGDRFGRAQVGGVLHRDRRQNLGGAFDDVDADEADAGGGAGAEAVGENITAGLTRRHRDRAPLEVRHGGEILGHLVHPDQRQRGARGGDVVLQRFDQRRLAHEHRREVRRPDRVQGPGRLHIHRQHTRRGEGAVRDDELHLFDPQLRGLGLERHKTLRAKPHPVARGRRRRHQVDVVTVGIDPVREHVVTHDLALLHTDRTDPVRHRRQILIQRPHGHVHLGLGHRATPIGHRVPERHRPRHRLRRRELQRPATIDEIQTALRLRKTTHIRHRQHITIGVRVILQHRQHRGLTRPHPVIIITSQRRPVHIRTLRQSVLKGLLRGLLGAVLGFLLLRRSHLLPVLHQAHIRIHQPHIAVGEIVQRDHVPVHPKLQHRPPRGLLNDFPQDLGAVAGRQITLRTRPGPVAAAVQPHRRRHIRRVGDGGGELGVDRDDVGSVVGAVQGDLEQGCAGGNENAVVLGTGLLKLERVCRQFRADAVHDQPAVLGVEQHGFLPHCGDLELAQLGQVARGGCGFLGRGIVGAEAFVFRGGSEDDAGRRHGDVTALTQLQNRVRRLGVKAQLPRGIDHPHLTGGRHHRQRVAAVDDLRPGRHIHPFTQRGERRVDPLDRAHTAVDQEDVITVLQHIERTRGGIDRPVQLLDLPVQPARQQLLTVRHPHVTGLEVHIRDREPLVQHSERQRNPSQHRQGHDGCRYPAAPQPRTEGPHPYSPTCAVRTCLARNHVVLAAL
nr:hypothetical protein BJQ95_03468 [Cryobacterium sp. SO1]